MKTPAPVTSLKWGDKITAAPNKQGRVFVAAGIVHTVLPAGGRFFAQLTEGKTTHNVYLNLDDEGSTWIRGHHGVASPEAVKLQEDAQVHCEIFEAEKLPKK